MEGKTFSFGYWVRRQRLALDLTQAALAQQVGCAPITIRKIEADERRPSRQMAERIAQCLAISDDEHETFVAAALGEQAVDALPLAQAPVVQRAPATGPGWMPAKGAEGAESGFVGRERELALLEGQLARVLEGEGRVVFVAGEAGQGKTALLAEFVRRAQEAEPALVAAQGYCAATAGTGQPYLPFRDILVSLSGDLEARWQAGLLDAEQAERLWRFAPLVAQTVAREGPQLVDVLAPAQSVWRWGEAPDAEQATAREAGEAQQGQIFEALTAVLQALAREQPLLLVLDDLQWVDAASAGLLFHLQRRLAGSRVLIAGAYRPSQALAGEGAASQTLQEAILESARLFGENQIDLQRLEPETARRLSDALLDREPNTLDEAFRVKLFWQTRGNPLFVIELLREMRAEGHLLQNDEGRWVQGGTLDWERLPGRVSAVVAQRLARLDDDERWALEIGSVEGERFTAAVVAALAGIPEAQLLRLLSRLQARHGLVEELGELQLGARRLARFQFSHALFQHYVYEALGQAQRRQMHAEIAEQLEQLHEGNVEQALPQLAHHFDAAGRVEEAVSYLIRAGDRARVVYALEEAAAYYRRAVAHLRDKGDGQRLAHTLMKLGQTQQIAFDYERGQEALDEAFVLWGRATGSALPEAGQTLRLLWQEPASLDPTMGGYNLTAPVANQLFSGLVAFGPESEIVPDVAQSWEVTDGGRRIVFQLRDDVLWSDGAPVTAFDFEFTYRRALSPQTEAPIAGQLLYAVKGAQAYREGMNQDPATVGVRALDAHTLLFELREATSYFVHNLAYYVLLPVPQHVVEGHGRKWVRSETIVTNGPFRLAAWEANRFILLQRNETYHGSFSGNLAQVHLTLEYAPEAQGALYEENRLDVASSWFGALNEIDRLRRQFTDEYVQRPGFITHYYYLDPMQPPFRDRRVRQALAMAVNREQLATLYGSGSIVAATGGFVPPGMPGHLAGCALPFDPRRARELLGEAGFEGGRDFPELTVATTEKAVPRATLLKKIWLDHLDIKANLTVIDLELGSVERAAHEPIVTMGGWIADYPDPDNFLRVDVQFDVPQWQDEEYLTLLERASRIADQEERLALYQAAERILAREAALVPLAYLPQQFMLKPWVKRYPTSAVKNPGFWKDVVVEGRG